MTDEVQEFGKRIISNEASETNQTIRSYHQVGGRNELEYEPSNQ